MLETPGHTGVSAIPGPGRSQAPAGALPPATLTRILWASNLAWHTHLQGGFIVTRIPRAALALIALASLVIASGCSSGTPSISDPNVVITKSVAAVPAVKSVHVKVEINGTVNIAAMSGGSSGIGISNIDLTGTTLEGDVDVANQAADLSLAVPGLLGTTGEIVVVGGNLYYKISLYGPKFTETRLSDAVPVSIPSPGAVASADPSAAIASLTKALADAGAKATLMADDKVDGKDVYHVSVSIPVDKINALLAAEGGSTTAGMQLDSASFDYWVYKDSILPAKFEIKGSAGTLGSLDVIVTLTSYNEAVKINAPAASDIGS